jgi:hypothetical protein
MHASIKDAQTNEEKVVYPVIWKEAVALRWKQAFDI